MRYTPLVLLFSFLSLVSCEEKEKEYRTYQGEIFGTYYKIQVSELEKDFQPAFDSVFALINSASNSYIQESEVSSFNHSGFLKAPSFTFLEMMDSAKKFHELSQGFFEPTLFPLIKAWGFSFEQRESMDSAKVAELKRLIGFTQKISQTDTGFVALEKEVKLDITGLGEGYAIDKLAAVLDQAGVKDYLVEIGGEMKAKGLNSRGAIWSIGIEDPVQVELGNTNVLLAKIELDHLAISSSGNYRKFYVDEHGIRRPHILDPLTGFPVSHSMVSVSVISKSATEADALATAFMSMGPEKAKTLAESIPGLEAMFVIGGKDQLSIDYTSGFPRAKED